MDIIGKILTTCEVDESGEFFRLNFEQEDGRPSSITLPIDCMHAFLMTLPGMIERALKARYHDNDYLLVYPTGGWMLQQAAHTDQTILTLQTHDGFKVAFALSPQDASDLASSLVDGEEATNRSLVVN